MALWLKSEGHSVYEKKCLAHGLGRGWRRGPDIGQHALGFSAPERPPMARHRLHAGRDTLWHDRSRGLERAR